MIYIARADTNWENDCDPIINTELIELSNTSKKFTYKSSLEMRDWETSEIFLRSNEPSIEFSIDKRVYALYLQNGVIPIGDVDDHQAMAVLKEVADILHANIINESGEVIYYSKSR